MVIPEGVLHRTTYGSKRHSRYLLNISRKLIPTAVLDEVTRGGYIFDTREDSLPRQLFCKIADEYSHGDRLFSEMIACYATELLSHLARHKVALKINRDASAVSYAVRRIRDGYKKEISLGAVAASLNITPEHLSRRFKAETGFGFNEYLTLLRLQHAEHMLKNEPGRSVAEIAFASGFNDSNYFSKRFKEVYGVSPQGVKNKEKKQA